ncbi:MAG: 50S ribosomal protein L29 [Acidobacteria bacterium]|nr:50S ribosomal protein L29 [Acidobacteriota bacterium]
MAKAAEFKDLGVEQLQQRADELDKELFTLRIRKAMGQVEKPLQIRVIRRDLARVKTYLRQKAGR